MRKSARPYLRALLDALLAAAVGGICGVIGTLFHVTVDLAGHARAACPWLIYLLPAAGVAIEAIYRLFRVRGLGTDRVLDAARAEADVPLGLLPAIFAGTALTHLCGGSAGREGAALQMGGVIGAQAGRMLRLNAREKRIAVLAGMAAFFTALFGTPLGATVFALTFVSVGLVAHEALLPALTASLTACGVSRLLGVAPTRFQVAAPAFAPGMLLRVAALGVICALAAAGFCLTIRSAERAAEKYLPNPWLRAALGGAALIVMTLLAGTTAYNGAGMETITEAVEAGTARPEAFACKLLFTAVTLAAGFRGGEVVPSFFVGATLGCTLAPLLGIPAGFAAAVGLAAVFCGAVNCPLGAIFLAVELFGADGLPYYALACALSYALSGYGGLYSRQALVSSKLTGAPLAAFTNAHRAKEEP